MKNTTKKIIAGLALGTMLVSSFGLTVANAADGDYTPERDLWEHPLAHTPSVYQADISGALMKDDRKTALEAMDFWINENRELGDDEDHLQKLQYYRDEMAEGRLHLGLRYMMHRYNEIAFANLLEDTRKGKYPQYTYVAYDDYYTAQDDVFDDSRDGEGTKPSQGTGTSTPVNTTPSQPSNGGSTSSNEGTTSGGGSSSNTSGNLGGNSGSTSNGWGTVAQPAPETPKYVAPAGKVKGKNIYVPRLNRGNIENWPNNEIKIQSIIRKSSLISKFRAYEPAYARAVLNALDKRLQKKVQATSNLFNKAVIEEVRLQLLVELS